MLRNSKKHLLLLFLSTIAIASCSYGVDTYSFSKNGKLHFGLTNEGSFFNNANCIQQITVEVRDTKPTETHSSDNITNEIVWQYGGLDEGCILSFPVEYGFSPDAQKISVAAKPLEANQIYEVHTISIGAGYGGHAFQLKERLTPFDLRRDR